MHMQREPEAKRPAGDSRGLPEGELVGLMLREAALRGRERWPRVNVPIAVFYEHTLHASGRAGMALGQLHLTDLYLACGCALGCRWALREFEEAYLAPVGQSLLRRGLPADTVTEVSQIVRCKLFVGGSTGRAQIAEYAGRSSLATWVRVVLERAFVSHQRTVRRGPAAFEETLRYASIEEANLDDCLLRSQYAEPLEEVLVAAVGSLAMRDRTYLRMYFAEGKTMDDIARAFTVSQSTVSRRIAAAVHDIRREICKLGKARLGISFPEAVEIGRILQRELTHAVSRGLSSEFTA